ncbi:Choline/ethanolaminephosphotransferase [Wolfiporia cocos MD-104 SS10]|uniref:diacylglycerol cholinephosphotransferase n=1 Tax=Wolfiporia cocos (strain MD-104) TaxID=742152 RepID=A0A2H3IWI0_WOLCO|nr:Choline/ethanolaminephosphotransferase [Wolfiporia cocos MD-104 SS10]
MGYIPQHALENLRKYSYKGIDKSLTSIYILQPFWTWFVSLWPTWVAPNTITLSGLCMVLLNFATLLYYDPTYLTDKEGAGPPQWIYLTWALGLFLYQTFDAIDGKQARRTGMAGPLGEMFDHGCDALNTTLEAVLAARALNLGRSWWTVASQIATLANFYLSTWEEYHTGILFLGWFSGPVEGILIIVGIYLISGVFGPSFWDQRLLDFTGLINVSAVANRVPNIPLNETFMVFGAFGLGFNILVSYLNVFNSRMSGNKNPFVPLLFLLPFPISAAMEVFWLSAPSIHESAILHSALFVPFMCAWGLQFAHQVSRMILAHVTKQPFPWWDSMWVWSIVGAVDANLPLLLNRPPLIQSSRYNIAVFVYVTLAVSFLSYARFCMLVIKDITNYLGIACFTVRKKDKSGEWVEAAVVDGKKH